jgi:hypothetical protein
VIILSGWTIGAGVIACADTATDKVIPAIASNLIILNLPKPANRSDLPHREIRLSFSTPCKLSDWSLEGLR